MVCFRELTDISVLGSYIHLRFIDLSNNNLRDVTALNSLTHILTLNLDGNKLTSASLNELPYLQTANFARNKIQTTEGISHPLLEQLNLNCKLHDIFCNFIYFFHQICMTFNFED